MAASAPIAKQLGLDFDTTAVLVGKLQMVGPGAGEAMGGLSKAVANLTQNGIPAKDALTSVIDTIKNAPNDTAAASDAMEVFGNRAGPKLAEMIRSGQFDLDALMTTIKESPVTIDSADNATDSFSDKLQQLLRTVQELLEPFGTALIGAGRDVLDVLIALLEPTGAITKGFQEYLKWLQPLVDILKDKFGPATSDIHVLLVGLYHALGDLLMPCFQKLWDMLVALGTFLRDQFGKALSVVGDAINSQLDVLKQMPGVSTLFANGQKAINDSLTDAKKKSDEAKASTDTLKSSHTGLTNALNNNTKPALTNVIGALGEAKTKKEELKTATELLKGVDDQYAQLLNSLVTPAHKPLWQALKDVEDAKKNVKTAADNLKTAENDLKEAIASGTSSTKDLKDAEEALKTAKEAAKTAADNLKNATNDLKVSQQDAKTAAKELDDQFKEVSKTLEQVTKEKAPPTTEAIKSILGAVQELNSTLDQTAQTKAYEAQKALKDLGIKPKEDLDALATNAEQNFKKILDAGKSSATEIDKAWVNMMEARRQALIQAGTDLSAQEQINLQMVKDKLDVKPTIADNWIKMHDSIKDSTSNLITDMLHGLFEGDTSFGEKAKNYLKGIGTAVVDNFTKPATDAISKFVADTLGSLIGGKGLGGVMDGLKGIGDAITKVFGGGGAAGAASNAGNAAQTGGTAGAAIATSMQGIMGLMNVITGAISAVTGVIGIFQNMHQETSLNAIEHNTRYSMMFLGEQGWDSIHGNTHDSKLILDDMKSYFVGVFNGVIGDIADRLFNILAEIQLNLLPKLDRGNMSLANIETGLQFGLNDVGSSLQFGFASMTSGLQQLGMQLAMQPPPMVNVYLDGNQIAANVEPRIERALRAVLGV